jgi:hypothetical protein
MSSSKVLLDLLEALAGGAERLAVLALRQDEEPTSEPASVRRLVRA